MMLSDEAPLIPFINEPSWKISRKMLIPHIYLHFISFLVFQYYSYIHMRARRLPRVNDIKLQFARSSNEIWLSLEWLLWRPFVIPPVKRVIVLKRYASNKVHICSLVPFATLRHLEYSWNDKNTIIGAVSLATGLFHQAGCQFRATAIEMILYSDLRSSTISYTMMAYAWPALAYCLI